MKSEAIKNPTPTQVEEFYQDWHRDALLTLYCECEVEYDGRASGYLGYGERTVLCKPDATLLVHRLSGRDPVNWQPPGGVITVSVDTDQVLVEARRVNPEERVLVRCSTVHHVVAYNAVDDAPLELTGTESDMHEYILEHPDVIEENLRVIEHERTTPYGQMDIYAIDESGHPVVIEVKRRQATHKHLDQLSRYMDKYREENPAARGILVAPHASENVKRGLREADLEFVKLDVFVESAAGSGQSTQLSDFE